MELRGSVLLCPWPAEERRQKQHHIFLEDGFGKELCSVVALQEPHVFQFQQQFQMMACVRDIFEGHGNGEFKQLVEWMEWSLLHGVEHFLLYTFDGSDAAVQDIYTKYLEAVVIFEWLRMKFYRLSRIQAKFTACSQHLIAKDSFRSSGSRQT